MPGDSPCDNKKNTHDDYFTGINYYNATYSILDIGLFHPN